MPDKHLCAYAVLFDEERRSVLLVAHVKAGLWLFPGGHVDEDEDPRVTAVREAREELGFEGDFHPSFGAEPLSLTVTRTVGEISHTDVSLYFVLPGDAEDAIRVDPREAHGSRWFRLDEPADWLGSNYDPEMQRFRMKLVAALERSVSSTN